jgi:hypothetical protein
LGNPQAQRRFRHGAELGHRQECKGLPQVHVRLYHYGIRKQKFFVLDASRHRTEYEPVLPRIGVRRRCCRQNVGGPGMGLRRNT